METKLEKEVRFLNIYAVVATLFCAIFLLTAFTLKSGEQKFEEIAVNRIKFVDSEGKERARIGAFFSSFSCCLAQTSNSDAVSAQQPASQQLSRQDAIRIAEAYHLWKSRGERIWAGWTDVPMPLLYITPDYEYAIGFP